MCKLTKPKAQLAFVVRVGMLQNIFYKIFFNKFISYNNLFI
jgi:hypothetical protein